MRLLRFAYDFVVGDDWRIAVGSVLVVGFVAGLTALGLNAWWLGPIGMPLILLATRRS